MGLHPQLTNQQQVLQLYQDRVKLAQRCYNSVLHKAQSQLARAITNAQKKREGALKNLLRQQHKRNNN